MVTSLEGYKFYSLSCPDPFFPECDNCRDPSPAKVVWYTREVLPRNMKLCLECVEKLDPTRILTLKYEGKL